MYFKDGNETIEQEWDVTPAFKALLVIIAGLIIALGIYPNLLLDWLHY